MFAKLDNTTLKKYNFQVSTPKVEKEELLNTSITLEKQKGLAIKFHSYSIEQVISSGG